MVGQVPEEQLAEEWRIRRAARWSSTRSSGAWRSTPRHPQIEDVDAVVHFEITDAPGGGSDIYEVVIRDGKIETIDEPTEQQPRVKIKTAPVAFLKLVTGQQSGPVMFMTGKLKLEGDVMFASQMTSFFRIPTAGG
jgi:putative sterol carrier protein